MQPWRHATPARAVTDTGEPFADGDDPDDAWNATDPVVTLLTLIARRIVYASWRPSEDRTARLLSIAEDVTRLRDRLELGDL